MSEAADDGEKIVRPTFGKVEGGKTSIFMGDNNIAAVLSRITLADFESIRLTEPKHGDETIGTLTEDECILFAKFHAATTRFKELQREVGGAQLEKLGAGIRSGDVDMEAGPVDGDQFIDHELLRELFRAQSYLDYTKSMFYHPLYERVGAKAWEYRLGIRTKRRIVRALRRY